MYYQKKMYNSISMDRKQGFIHLGKSKSPENFKRVIAFNSQRPNQNNPVSKQKLNHNHSMLSQTIRAMPQIQLNKENQNNFSNNFSAFTTINCKQNILEQRQSNSKNIELQLHAKIKLLQARIQQLHHEKQACIVNSHAQNKRILDQNTFLRQKLAEMEQEKKIYIINMKQQISKLSANTPNFGKQEEIKIKISLVDQFDDHHKSNSSIDHHLRMDSKSIQMQNISFKQKMARMQSRLKIYEFTQQENKNLQQKISMLQNKINTTHQGCQQVKIASKNIIEMANQLQNSRKQVQFYVQKTLEKSQYLMKIQSDYKQNLQKMKTQKEILQSKLNQLMLKTTQDEQNKLQNTPISLQRLNNTFDSCSKCQNLVKALIKLNQKAYTNPGAV